jgi:hypothetical protein
VQKSAEGAEVFLASTTRAKPRFVSFNRRSIEERRRRRKKDGRGPGISPSNSDQSGGLRRTVTSEDRPAEEAAAAALAASSAGRPLPCVCVAAIQETIDMAEEAIVVSDSEDAASSATASAATGTRY